MNMWCIENKNLSDNSGDPHCMHFRELQKDLLPVLRKSWKSLKKANLIAMWQ